MNRYLLTAATAATAGLLVLTGCSSSSKSASPATTPAATTSAVSSPAPATSAGTDATAPAITISNFAYAGTLTVKAGATVTVTNNDSAAHTLTDKATKKFDTGNIAGNGGTGTFVAPTTPGSYPFGCTYHPNMAGTLVVTG